MYIAASEKPIDSAVSESVMVMSMSEQTTVDKYTLEEGSNEEKRKEENPCNTIKSRKAGSIQEGAGEIGQVE